jgi:hypothetical protein
MERWIFQITPQGYGGEIGCIDYDLQNESEFEWEVYANIKNVNIGDEIKIQCGLDQRSKKNRISQDGKMVPLLQKGVYLQGEIINVDYNKRTVTFSINERFFLKPKDPYNLGRHRGLYNESSL